MLEDALKVHVPEKINQFNNIGNKLLILLDALLLRGVSLDADRAAALDRFELTSGRLLPRCSTVFSIGALALARRRGARVHLLQAFDVVKDNLCATADSRNNIALVELCLELAVCVGFLRDQAVARCSFIDDVLQFRTLDGLSVVVRLKDGPEWYWIRCAMFEPSLAADGL